MSELEDRNQIAVIEAPVGEEIVKRGRGRPKGSVNKATQFLHYNPKKWEPWMESLVLASVAGNDNKTLAERYEISITHVSNLLNCPQAVEVRRKVSNELLKSSRDIADGIDRIRTKALKTVEKALDNNGFVDASPYSSAMLAMKAYETFGGKGKKDSNEDNSGGNTTINQNILVANPSFMKTLTEAVEKSNNIKERNQKFIEENPGSLKLVANG